MMDNTLWTNKTQYIELSFFRNTCNTLKITPLTFLDFARDLIHPGIVSAKAAAIKIAEMITL